MRNAFRWSIAVMALGVAVTACAPGDDGNEAEQVDAVAVPDVVLRVASAANAIVQRPAAADSVLTAHGFTRAEFDSLLYEIAAEPSWTEAYQGARR